MTRLQMRYEELGRRAYRAQMNGEVCQECGFYDAADQQYQKAKRLDAKARKFKRKMRLAAQCKG